MDINSIRTGFGSKLQQILKEKGITKNALASKVGIDRSNITKYINGESSPKIDVFFGICLSLQVQPSFFFDDLDGAPIAKSEKNAASKIIESVFCLFRFGLMTAYQSQYFENAWVKYAVGWSQYRPILQRVMMECQTMASSRLVEEENICQKIINAYEKDLEEELESENLEYQQQ